MQALVIKMGRKHLFIRVDSGALREIEPLSVLDFYVHESCQRRGLGKCLYERMLRDERTVPAALAYDRPSSKFIAFLAKHYGLRDYLPQSNNFVVFRKYFSPETSRAQTAAAGGMLKSPALPPQSPNSPGDGSGGVPRMSLGGAAAAAAPPRLMRCPCASRSPPPSRPCAYTCPPRCARPARGGTCSRRCDRSSARRGCRARTRHAEHASIRWPTSRCRTLRARRQ